MAKQISPSMIKEAIIEKAKVIKKRKQIYESLLAFDKELAALNEVGMVGSFGFSSSTDAATKNNTTTGFAPVQNLSHVKDLMDQMEKEGQSATDAETIKKEHANIVSVITNLVKEGKVDGSLFDFIKK
jgi:hypothetical protein